VGFLKDGESALAARQQKQIAERRAKELEWAYSIGPNDTFADFATASAIIFRNEFGDDFCGMVNAKGKNDEPVALYIEGADAGESVKVSIMSPEEGGRAAAQALESGEPPDLSGIEMREVNVYSIRDIARAALEA